MRGRSFKDYLIYIITVTISFSLIFAFNLMSLSEDLQSLTKYIENFKYAIMFVSFIVIFVIGWLINYTMNFMFEKRSKEFGTYMLLGIEKKDINKMFFTENIIFSHIFISFSFSHVAFRSLTPPPLPTALLWKTPVSRLFPGAFAFPPAKKKHRIFSAVIVILWRIR